MKSKTNTMLSLVILIVSSLWVNLQQEVKENRIAITEVRVAVARIETAMGINPIPEKPQVNSGKLAAKTP